MKVRIAIFATLRRKLKWSEKVVELKGEEATLRDVLNHTPELRDIIVVNDDINRGFMVLVNGINVLLVNGLDTKVKNDDKISIFPPGGGG